MKHQCSFARGRHAPTRAATTLVIINTIGFDDLCAIGETVDRNPTSDGVGVRLMAMRQIRVSEETFEADGLQCDAVSQRQGEVPQGEADATFTRVLLLLAKKAPL